MMEKPTMNPPSVGNLLLAMVCGVLTAVIVYLVTGSVWLALGMYGLSGALYVLFFSVLGAMDISYRKKKFQHPKKE
jgi:hypothetical protein